jgi:hypothetical protein
MFILVFQCHSLEMLDRIEPPAIPDGYGISVAYACLLDIIHSVSSAIDGNTSTEEQGDETKSETEEKDTQNQNSKTLKCQMINSSWCGLLAALSPLLEARLVVKKYIQIGCYINLENRKIPGNSKVREKLENSREFCKWPENF